MKNLAIIPARSGSKGLIDKNIRLLLGKPLIGYSIEAALNSGLFEEVFVSTDSEQYADIATHLGASVPFLRSETTSGDYASSWDVVTEVLNEYFKRGKVFDTICLLQPTSPLRTVEDILKGYNLLTDKAVDSITSVCEVDHSPLLTMQLDESLSLKNFRNSIEHIGQQRQAMGVYFRLNGALYIRKVQYSDNGIKIINEKELAYIMPKERSVDIDDEYDFEFAEFFLKRNCFKE